MAKALAEAGIEVHIATTDDDGPGRVAGPSGRPMHEQGVTCWYFPRQTRFYTASWPLTRWLAKHVQEYDLLHIHALFSYAALPAAFFAQRRQAPYIVRPLGTLSRYGVHQRRPWLKRLSLQLIEQHILRNAEVIHYTSRQEQSEAMELGLRRPAVVIPNPVELPAVSMPAGQFRRRYPWLAQRTIILFLSRLDPKKGLDLLLPAFARIRASHPQAALVIAGNGEPAFVQGMQRQAEQLGIAGNVLWTGFLAAADKESALSDADIFVLPSYSENFGNVVVEAMACGLPVVVSDQVGIAHEIAAAEAGLVVDCSVASLDNALQELISNPGLQSRLASNGHTLLARSFSLPAITAQLIELYQTVVQQPFSSTNYDSSAA
jgi:glycosyltransferase involved in cell wall biosynthesis